MTLRSIAQDLLENADTTLQQLGGKRALMMIGGSAMKDGTTLILKWKATAKNKARGLRVELDPSDTYNMIFTTLSGKEIKRFDGVYADQLKEIFERETALYLSL